MSRIAAVLAGVIVLAGFTAPGAVGFAGHNGRIVYAYSGRDVAANTSLQQLLSVRPDGSDPLTIGSCTTDATTGLASCNGPVGTDPAVSADGRMLAFVRDGRLWISTIDGSGAHAVTPTSPDHVPIGDPAWAPDGRHLAFTNDGNVDVVRPDGEFQHTIVRFGRRPAWSPSGHTIVFVHDDACGTRSPVCARDIEFTNIAGTYVRVLIHGGYDAPTWSPHGSRLALIDFRGVDKAGFPHSPAIVTIASNGRGVRQLTLMHGDRIALEPPDIAWAPDGKTIALKDDTSISIVAALGGPRHVILFPGIHAGYGEDLIEGIDWARG